MAIQNVAAELSFRKRKGKDVLASTVEKAWEQFEEVKLTNIWERWRLVLDLIIEDEGLGELVGKDEWGRPLRMRGRRADVTKPLIAASSMLTERIGSMDASGGIVFD